MVLVIDIGNTNISFGLFKGRRPRVWHISSDAMSASTINKAFKRYIRRGDEIEGIMVSSVVPRITNKMKYILKKRFSSTGIYILGQNAEVPIRNLYLRPKEVGQDRLVNAFAAVRRFGKRPIVVADFGTAVTFDAISKSGSYLGGIVFPGLELSLRALSERAALLPRITLRRPKAIIGRTTAESMRSGIFYGFSALVEGVIERLKSRLGYETKVIATGGAAKRIIAFCRQIDNIDANLTLKGLFAIYLDIKRRNLAINAKN